MQYFLEKYARPAPPANPRARAPGSLGAGMLGWGGPAALLAGFLHAMLGHELGVQVRVARRAPPATTSLLLPACCPPPAAVCRRCRLRAVQSPPPPSRPSTTVRRQAMMVGAVGLTAAGFMGINEWRHARLPAGKGKGPAEAPYGWGLVCAPDGQNGVVPICGCIVGAYFCAGHCGYFGLMGSVEALLYFERHAWPWVASGRCQSAAPAFSLWPAQPDCGVGNDITVYEVGR